VKGYLLDENLPVGLTFQPSLPVHHARQFGANPTDSELWETARRHQLVIVTKDTDFLGSYSCVGTSALDRASSIRQHAKS
jgi:predicted nuclease of predicted toxin-antitoxin system